MKNLKFSKKPTPIKIEVYPKDHSVFDEFKQELEKLEKQKQFKI